MTSHTSIFTLWLLVFNRDGLDIGHRFSIDVTNDENINDLKTKVKDMIEGRLSQIIATELTIWRCKDRRTFFDGNTKVLFRQIQNVFSPGEKVEVLSASQKLADLQISEEETLLVETPVKAYPKAYPVGIPITQVPKKVPHKFESFYLQVHTKGGVTEADIELNDVNVYEGSHVIPGFIKEHENVLGQKRTISDEMRAIAELWVGEAASKEYFDYSKESTENPQSIPTISRIERCHFGMVSTMIEAKMWRKRLGNDFGRHIFTTDDANWFFFYPFAQQIQSAPDIAVEIYEVPGEHELRPFPLVIEVGQFCYTCNFQSDFHVLKCGFPRMAAVVELPLLEDEPAEGYYRLLLQGASVVRFANTYLDAYKDERNFVFTAIYINDIGDAFRYLLYQRGPYDTVYCKKKIFELGNKNDRISFILELYNFSSKLQKEGSGDTRTTVDELKENVRQLRLPTFTFTSKAKRLSSDDEDDQPCTSVHQKSEDGGITDQLEACGYEVVPDVFEAAGGTWELIFKLPPHLRTVYRRGDRSKTELIAKQVRKGLNELPILEYLNTKQPRSPHIISLIEATPQVTKEWIILPKESRFFQSVLDAHGVPGRDQLGWGLVKGLAYLHEHNIAHRAINPDNLVCAAGYQLQIIDFDLADQVQDENTMTDWYAGEKSEWTPREMGDQDGPTRMHSPIRADRWSCGRVLLRFILVRGGDERLCEFAGRLLAFRPWQRPSLLEWHDVLVGRPPMCPTGLEDGVSQRREMVGSDSSEPGWCRQM